MVSVLEEFHCSSTVLFDNSASNNYVGNTINLYCMYMHKLKEKLGILSSIKDHRKKRETREVTYTCRCTSEHFIPNSVPKTKTEFVH